MTQNKLNIMSNTQLFGEQLNFDMPKNKSASIKVIGVGGGGTNAVNHMFYEGIKGVDFVVCNTDAQALNCSPVPVKIQLGVNLTEGLGAGNNPNIGKQAALESTEIFQEILGNNTKMIFITAGMGGGTGSGAAPVLAQISQELGIITVGIVTLPFYFEGKKRIHQAKQGIEELRKNVDSLILINNEKLRELYGDLKISEGFKKADEVLATAAKAIAEVITHHYTVNIDLHDVKTVLEKSGTAIMGSAKAEGKDRAKVVIKEALDSPLLNNTTIKGAKSVLLLIVSGAQEATIDEIGEINDFIQQEAVNLTNIIFGLGMDESLEEKLSVTIIATGFPDEQQDLLVDREEKKIYHTLEEEQAVTKLLDSKNEKVNDDCSNLCNLGLGVLKNPISDNRDNDGIQLQIDFDLSNTTNKKGSAVLKNSKKQFSSTNESDIAKDNILKSCELDDKSQEENKRVFMLDDDKEIDGMDSRITSSNSKDNNSRQEELLEFSVRSVESVEGENSYTADENLNSEEEMPYYETSLEEIEKKQRISERKKRLLPYQYVFSKTKEDKPIIEEPAFKKKGIDIESSDRELTNITLNLNSKDDMNLEEENTYLYNRPD